MTASETAETQEQYQTAIDYHSRSERSSSQVADFLDDPIQWFHVHKLRDWKKEPTAAMRLGTSTHTMIEVGLPMMIARGGWESLVREIPREALNADGHCKGKQWTEWKAENPAEIYFKPGEPNPLRQVWEHLQASKWCRDFIEVSYKEVEHVWDDPLLGPCRCKMDAVSVPILCDWKTTSKRDARTFAADAFARNYDVRLAMYSRGFEDKYGCRPEVYIVAIQTTGGMVVNVYQMPSEWLEDAEARLLLACDEMDNFDIAKHLDVGPVPLVQPRYAVLDLEKVA